MFASKISIQYQQLFERDKQSLLMRKLTSLLLFAVFSAFAQKGDSQMNIPASKNSIRENYAVVDSLARIVTYKGSLEILSNELTENYISDFDKARAIFIWISDNIGYDYKFVNKNKKLKHPKCQKDEDCDLKRHEWETAYLEKIIRDKKAICDGYSRLFKRLCDYAGIQGSVVSGYTKETSNQIGSLGMLNHAWNVILVDGKYYFFDVTWASGGCGTDEKGKLTKFQKGFNEYYWLTPIEKLSRNHYPEDEIWVKPSGITKMTYANTPYILGSEMENIDIITPDSGVIEACVGDTIIFSFRYKDWDIERLQVNTNIDFNPYPWVEDDNGEVVLDEKLMKKQKYTDFIADNEMYTFTFVADKKNLRYIAILIDYQEVMRFKIKVAN